jgi:hypothetical protein
MTTDVTTRAVETALASIGSKANYTGAGVTATGWFLSSEAAVAVGILLGFGGWIVSWYYHRLVAKAQIKDLIERAAREREAHKKFMGGCE